MTVRVLFQGDSITDAFRDREDLHSLAGYSKYAAELLGKKYECFNRGVSGDTSAMVLARYEEDIDAIEPDIFCLLIGINDVWRRFDSNFYTPPQEYGKNVREILTRLRKKNRNVKIVLIEPFLFPEPTRIHWRTTLIEVIDELRKTAVEFADAYIPMDGLWAKECIHTQWTKFSNDGVHLTDEGHRTLAKYVVEEIKNL